jgi:SHS2 domain-containing protein
MPAGRGHRTLPHTADLTIEAWGESRRACFEEAVRGFVATYLDTAGAVPTEAVTVELPPTDDDAELLVQVLEEVIVLGEVRGLVPVDVTVTVRNGGLGLRFATVPIQPHHLVGATPKAVARSDLVFVETVDGWRCRATIDV